jgi:hypothetical protein
MNQKSKIKIWRDYALVVSFICGVVIAYFGHSRYNERRIEFLAQYYDTYESAKQEILSADYFELDWLKTSAITMIESGGHKDAHSGVAIGYKQLNKYFMSSYKNYIHKIADIKLNCNIKDTRFQMWAGNFIIKHIQDNLTTGSEHNARYNRALLIYNMGYGGLRRSPSYKINYSYVSKWSKWHNKLKYEWKKYPKFF